MSRPSGSLQKQEGECSAERDPVPQRVGYARAAVPVILGAGCVLLALRLPVGTLGRPGPGMWPLICGLLLLGAAVVGIRGKPADDEEPFTRRSAWVAVAAASLAAFAFALPLVGFEVSLVFLLVIWLKGFGREGWRLTVALSLGATGIFHLLFIELLGLQIPHLF